MLVAILSLWFNADAGLLAAGFGPAGAAHAIEIGDGPAPEQAPAQAAQQAHAAASAGEHGDAEPGHGVCFAHCVPAVMAVAAQPAPPQDFHRIGFTRLPEPPGHRVDPPAIPPEYPS